MGEDDISFTQQLIIAFQGKYSGPASGTLSNGCMNHHPGRDAATHLCFDSADHVRPIQGAAIGTDLRILGCWAVWVKVVHCVSHVFCLGC